MNTRKTWIASILALGLLFVATQMTAAIGSNARQTASAGPEFGYSGDSGPGFWADLDPAWVDCGQDARQSPIRLTRVTVDPELRPLQLELHGTPINLINNGHTIEHEYEPGSTITWDGVGYELKQFHFHTPSEHTTKNRRYVMELHAVFSDDATGNIVVVGQFYRLGKEDSFLAEFDGMLPEKEGDHTSSPTVINLADGLADTTSYWTYQGSLTTPPCSPVVTWVVLKSSATMSDAQLRDHFWHIMGENFRPIQDRNHRTIRSTNP